MKIPTNIWDFIYILYVYSTFYTYTYVYENTYKYMKFYVCTIYIYIGHFILIPYKYMKIPSNTLVKIHMPVI